MTSSRKRRAVAALPAALCMFAASSLVIVSCGDDSADPKNTSRFDAAGEAEPAPTFPSSSGFPNQPTPKNDAEPPRSDGPCVESEAPAIEGSRPVDIIFAIDNSYSMTGEIAEVEKQINDNFISIIAGSGVDYHVVMLSSHGKHDGDGGDPFEHICVKSPLSGTNCDPIPAEPAENEHFFHHDIVINSQDSWCKIIQTFEGPDEKGRHPQGWKTFLRPGAFKIFSVITDDRVLTQCTDRGGNLLKFDDKSFDAIGGTAAASYFDSVLVGLAPEHFGTSANRNYTWHSIVGLKGFDQIDTSKPHPPEAPLVTETCGGDVEAPGIGYQALSKLTGGLRFPTCGLNYTRIFQEMASSVIRKGVLACDYDMPVPDAGVGTIDPLTAVVRYSSGSNVTDFEQVRTEAECGPNKFFIANNRVKLCPASCQTVQNDLLANVKILFGCIRKGSIGDPTR